MLFIHFAWHPISSSHVKQTSKTGQEKFSWYVLFASWISLTSILRMQVLPQDLPPFWLMQLALIIVLQWMISRNHCILVSLSNATPEYKSKGSTKTLSPSYPLHNLEGGTRNLHHQSCLYNLSKTWSSLDHQKPTPFPSNQGPFLPHPFLYFISVVQQILSKPFNCLHIRFSIVFMFVVR